jgi:hypothetical protein
MEYVARLFIEGGGFQGIANAHNAALEPAKAETQAASHLVLNSHGSRLTKHHICIAQNSCQWESRDSPQTRRTHETTPRKPTAARKKRNGVAPHKKGCNDD